MSKISVHEMRIFKTDNDTGKLLRFWGLTVNGYSMKTVTAATLEETASVV
jgi:hypothetical protein